MSVTTNINLDLNKSNSTYPFGWKPGQPYYLPNYKGTAIGKYTEQAHLSGQYGSQRQQSSLGQQSIAGVTDVLTSYLSGLASDKLFGNSEIGRNVGSVLSTGLTTIGSTITDNLLKGQTALFSAQRQQKFFVYEHCGWARRV